MKSIIIIIIAIFLETLTAKADWVNAGSYDKLDLGVKEVTFSKYSPDYTKFVTYSAQDSTLRLWDLETGKVIKERIFEWKYSFTECEFDFQNEIFYFHISQGQVYPNSLKTIADTNQYLWYINFEDSLQYCKTVTGGFYYSNGGAGSNKNYLNKIILFDNYVYIHYTQTGWFTPNGTMTESYGGFSVECKLLDKKIIVNKIYDNGLDKINKYDNGYFATINSGSRTTGTHGGPVDYSTQKIGMYLNFGNSSLQLTDPNTKYPYLNSSSIDIAYNSYVFNDTNKNIMFYSKDEDKLLKLKVGYKSNEIRNFKLIQSPQYSMFYRNTNKLEIYDNRKEEIISTFNLPEGKLGYDNNKNIAYSNKSNYLYKVSTNLYNRGFVDIYVKKDKYVVGDTVNVFKIVSNKFKDVKLDIDNKLFLDSIAVFKSNKIGVFGAKLSYYEDSVFKIFTIDTLFEVRDSLRVTYKVNNDYNNNIKYPFYCEAFINDTNSSITWSYSWCEIVYIKDRNGIPVPNFANYTKKANGNKISFSLKYEVGESQTPFILKVENGFQSLVFHINLKVYPNLTSKFDSYSGVAPFTFKTIFENTILQHVNNQYCNSNTKMKELLIGDSIKYIKSGFSIDTIVNTIYKPGIYPITMKYQDYLGGITVTHDSVITVLAPTDIQDFAERKYIFKQDADGIYCQLEGEGEVSLYDNVGRLVRTYQIENERYIRKEDLERGVYFLSIQTNGNVCHEKVLVE